MISHYDNQLILSIKNRDIKKFNKLISDIDKVKKINEIFYEAMKVDDDHFIKLLLDSKKIDFNELFYHIKYYNIYFLEFLIKEFSNRKRYLINKILDLEYELKSSIIEQIIVDKDFINDKNILTNIQKNIYIKNMSINFIARLKYICNENNYPVRNIIEYLSVNYTTYNIIITKFKDDIDKINSCKNIDKLKYEKLKLQKKLQEIGLTIEDIDIKENSNEIIDRF